MRSLPFSKREPAQGIEPRLPNAVRRTPQPPGEGLEGIEPSLAPFMGACCHYTIPTEGDFMTYVAFVIGLSPT
jgi:hypothetical protein